MAEKKTHLSAGAQLARAVIANWLVCLAVWQTNAATDVTGKIIAVWFPIVAFTALGMEHSIANMFLVPAGVFNGASVPFGDVVRNVVVATAGNILGGSLGVALPYWLVYGSGATLLACVRVNPAASPAKA